jgi:restriction endonuclease S subunit
MKWKKIKLGEVIFKKNLRMKDAPEIIDPLVLGVTNNEGVVISKVEAGQKIEDYFIVNKGDFVYNPYRINVGSIGISEYDGITSLAYVVFNVDEDKINKYLLFKFLKSEFGVKEIIKNGRGSVRNALRFDDLSKIEIYLPPIEVQNTFIENFKKQEYKSNLLNRQLSHQLTLLDQLNQAILQEAVQGKLVPQDPNDEPASELLKRIKAEKLNGSDPSGRRKKEKPLPPIKPEEIPFEIPENWVWCRLGEVADNVEYGTSQKAEMTRDDIPVLRMNNIQSGKLDLSNLKYVSRMIDDLPRLYLKDGDLLFNRTNSYELVGKTAVYRGSNDSMTFASYIIRVQFYKEIISEFISNYINSPICRETQLEPEIIQQNGQANFNGTKLKNILVPLPPLSEQKRIVAEIERQLAQTKQLKEHIIANQAATEQLLKALLHQAFEVKENEEHLAKA